MVFRRPEVGSSFPQADRFDFCLSLAEFRVFMGLEGRKCVLFGPWVAKGGPAKSTISSYS